jgi:hypothetical protein
MQLKSTPRDGHPRLEDLIPIAVVIAAGCEPCARRMVERAIAAGSSPRDIRRTVAIVSQLSRQDCIQRAVGSEVVRRMGKPLAMATATLEGATSAVRIEGGAS